MSEIRNEAATQAPSPARRKRRSRRSRFVEFLFWIALSLLTAWILIQNVDRILPANNF